jgi:hypothetical protein
LIEAFHDACAKAIWNCDGLPDMIKGDGRPQDCRLKGFDVPSRL